jgi:Tfp pilus assembly protein PilN
MSPQKERAMALRKELETRNGGRLEGFSQKEVFLMLCGDLREQMTSLDQKLSENIKTFQAKNAEFSKVLADHDKIFQHIVDELPEKGYCAKVEKMNQDLYPADTQEPSVPQKVNILWNDRRWLKGLLYFLVALGFFNIIVAWFHF